MAAARWTALLGRMQLATGAFVQTARTDIISRQLSSAPLEMVPATTRSPDPARAAQHSQLQAGNVPSRPSAGLLPELLVVRVFQGATRLPPHPSPPPHIGSAGTGSSYLTHSRDNGSHRRRRRHHRRCRRRRITPQNPCNQKSAPARPWSRRGAPAAPSPPCSAAVALGTAAVTGYLERSS
eukprot:COSAG01_NODE_20676_length_940_cov_16.224732_1_plen_180_part_10